MKNDGFVSKFFLKFRDISITLHRFYYICDLCYTSGISDTIVYDFIGTTNNNVSKIATIKQLLIFDQIKYFVTISSVNKYLRWIFSDMYNLSVRVHFDWNRGLGR